MARLRAMRSTSVKQPKKTKTIEQQGGALNKETKKPRNRVGALQGVDLEFIHGPSGQGLKGYSHGSGLKGYGIKGYGGNCFIVE